MDVEGACPVCEAPFSFEIDDIDAGSQAYECDSCGASLEASYSVTIEVDEVEVTGGVEAEVECPRCHASESLDITEESGEAETDSSCGATLSVSWSSWGRETKAEVTDATVEYDCPCGDSSSFDITEESGEKEVECDSCGGTLTVTWSDWGEQVRVQRQDKPDGEDDEEDEDDEEEDEDEDDEEEDEDEDDEEEDEDEDEEDEDYT